MSGRLSTCQVCGHRLSETDLDRYTDFTCQMCGQLYEYNEGHSIVLDEEQLKRIHKSVMLNCVAYDNPAARKYQLPPFPVRE